MAKNENTKPKLKINNVEFRKNTKNEEYVDKTLKEVLNLDISTNNSKLKKLMTFDNDNKNLNININVYQNIIESSPNDKNNSKKYVKMLSKHSKKFKSDEILPDVNYFNDEEKLNDEVISQKSLNSSFSELRNNTKISNKESVNEKNSVKFKKKSSVNNISFNNPTINSLVSKHSRENIEINVNQSTNKLLSNNFTSNIEENKFLSKKGLISIANEKINNVKNHFIEKKKDDNEIKEVEDSNSLIIFDKINNNNSNFVSKEKEKNSKFKKTSYDSIDGKNPINAKLNYEKSDKWKKLSNAVSVMTKLKQYDITPIERSEDFDSNIEDYNKRLYPNSPLLTVKKNFQYPKTDLKLTKSVYDKELIDKRIEKICKINNINKKLEFDSSDIDLNRDESDLIRMLQNLYKRRSYIEELPSIENQEGNINHLSKFNNKLVEVKYNNDNFDSNNNLNINHSSINNNGELVNDLIIHLSDPELQEMTKIGLIDKIVYYITNANDLSFNLLKIVFHVLEEEIRICKNTKNITKFISDQMFYGMTFVYLACREGNIELLKFLVSEKKLDYQVVSYVRFDLY